MLCCYFVCLLPVLCCCWCVIKFLVIIIYSAFTFSYFFVRMNRLFGRAKPKQPPPNLTDCISNVRKFVSKVLRVTEAAHWSWSMLLHHESINITICVIIIIRQHFRFKVYFSNLFFLRFFGWYPAMGVALYRWGAIIYTKNGLFCLHLYSIPTNKHKDQRMSGWRHNACVSIPAIRYLLRLPVSGIQCSMISILWFFISPIFIKSILKAAVIRTYVSANRLHAIRAYGLTL